MNPTLPRYGTDPIQQNLEEHPHTKLDITRRVVREQSTKVRIVHLSRAVEFQALERPDVKGVCIPAGKAFRNTRTEEVERQGANCLTGCNSESNAVEYSIHLGQRSRLTWICSIPRIDIGLRQESIARQSAKPERSVTGIIVSEGRMIERIDQVDPEVDFALSIVSDKRQVKALLNRDVEKLLHWRSDIQCAWRVSE